MVVIVDEDPWAEAAADNAAEEDVPIDDDPWADEHDEVDAHAVETSLGGVLGHPEADADTAPAAPAHAKPAPGEAEPEAEATAPELVPLPPDDDEDEAKPTPVVRADTPLRELDDTHTTPLGGKDTDPAEEKQCRICLGGVEDEEDMGRLISPCLCTGSMRVSVSQACLCVILTCPVCPRFVRHA